jgi:tRNA (guanine-N7-)-methyltransferase
MGRRALRKVDPKLDLTRHLKTPDDLSRPWNQAAVFACALPLEVEVGSGKGLFMETAASACPEHNFLGIEIATRYARYCAARLARRDLTNAVVVHGDANAVFCDALPDASGTAVHIYFPDPWWKKRHHKRRLMAAPFLQQVERVLQPSGRLHFWTDVREYFDQSLAIIAEHTSLAGPQQVIERPAAHHLDFRTHFERRTRLAREAVYRAEFEKM